MDPSQLQNDAAQDQEEAVRGACECLCEGLNDYITQKELQLRICQQAARECLEAAFDVVALVYPNRQQSAITPISAVNGSWEPDPEPVPCRVERWNRGFLQIAQELPSAPTDLSLEAADAAKKPRVPSGRKADSRPASPVRRESNRKLVTNESAVLSEQDLKLEERLREEIVRRTEQSRAVEEMRIKMESEAVALAAMRQDMRGKEYAYDHQGSVIMVTAIDANRLPKPMVMPVFQTKESGDEDAAGKGKRLEGKGEKPSRQPKRNATDFVERPSEAQPSPIATMAMAPGVSLKAGTATRSGPEARSEANQMTRDQFSAYARKQAQGGKGPPLKSLPFSNMPRAEAPLAALPARTKSDLPAIVSSGSNATAAVGVKLERYQSLAPVEPHLLQPMRRATKDLPAWVQDGEPRAATPPVARAVTPDMGAYIASAGSWGNASGSAYQPPVPIAQPIRHADVPAISMGNRHERLPRLQAQQAAGKLPASSPQRQGPAGRSTPSHGRPPAAVSAR